MSLSLLTLPSEFVQGVSANFLQPPISSFFWASVYDAATRMMELNLAQANGVIPAQALAVNGMPMPSFNERANLLNENLPGLFTVENMQGRPGQMVSINRVAYQSTTYTEASRRTTRATIGTAGVDLRGEVVQLTLDEFSGPLIAAAGAVGPHIIEEFDLNRMPIHALQSRVADALRFDRFTFIDTVIGTKAVSDGAMAYRVYPGDYDNAIATDAAAFITSGDRAMDLETLARAEEVATINKVQRFPNNRWAVVVTPRQLRQLRTCAAWQKSAVFMPSYNLLTGTYVGTVGMCDIYLSDSNPTVTVSTSTVQQGVLMGPGVLGAAIVPGSFMVRTDPGATNYGRRVPLIWTAVEGIGVLDNRFGVLIRSN